MQIDRDRIAKYLDEIVSETTDLKTLLSRDDEEILSNQHLLKSLKYSTIVIAEAIAGTLQHVLAKRHNAVVDGYMEVFRKSREYHVMTEDLISRLQPFLRFRNMLVHQYWRVNNQIFLKNLRDGLKDFNDFVKAFNTLLIESDRNNIPKWESEMEG